MNKKTLLLWSMLCTIIFSSCSTPENNQKKPESDKGLPKADYHDLFIGLTSTTTIYNKECYYFYISDGGIGPSISDSSIRKVTSNGQVITLIDFNKYMPYPYITSTESAIYFIANSADYSNTAIHWFTPPENQYQTYDLTPKFQEALNLDFIGTFGDNSIVYFEMHSRTLRRYFPETGADEFMLGTGYKGQGDGIGNQASLVAISDMAYNSHDKTLYFIDNLRKIRKIEQISPSEYKLTTLVHSFPKYLRAINIDSQGEVLVLVDGIGINKLNDQNEIVPYLTGVKSIKNLANNSNDLLDLKKYYGFEIDKEDLYLFTLTKMTKISNYKYELNL